MLTGPPFVSFVFLAPKRSGGQVDAGCPNQAEHMSFKTGGHVLWTTDFTACFDRKFGTCPERRGSGLRLSDPNKIAIISVGGLAPNLKLNLGVQTLLCLLELWYYSNLLKNTIARRSCW